MRLIFLLLLLTGTAQGGSIVSGGTGSGSIVSGGVGSGSIETSYSHAPESNPCVGTFLSDTFTESGTGNISVESHTPDSGGGSWLRTEDDGGEVVVDRSTDELKSTNNSGNTKLTYWSLTANCTNYSVFASVKTGGATNSSRVGVLGRWLDTSGGNGYRFRLEGDGALRLESVTNGTAILIDSDTVASFSASTYYTLELRMSGTTIQGYVNDVLECSATNTTHTSAGSPGSLLRNSSVRMTSLSAAYP